MVCCHRSDEPGVPGREGLHQRLVVCQAGETLPWIRCDGDARGFSMRNNLRCQGKGSVPVRDEAPLKPKSTGPVHGEPSRVASTQTVLMGAGLMPHVTVRGSVRDGGRQTQA